MTEFERAGREVEDEIEIAATPEACYAAFAEPERIARWFVDRATGAARVGETITWTFEDFGLSVPYEVVAADEGQRFAVGFHAPGRPPGLLDVTFTATDGGKTHVRLVNSGFQEGAEWDDEYEGIVSGWTMALTTLRHQLENFADVDRTGFLAMRPVQIALRDVVPFYRSAAGLARWLTTEGEIGAVGSRVRLALRDGPEVHGEVLAHTAWESLVSWEGEDAVLGLKAFRMGPAGTCVAVHASSWTWGAEQAKGQRELLDAAVGRLAEALG